MSINRFPWFWDFAFEKLPRRDSITYNSLEQITEPDSLSTLRTQEINEHIRHPTRQTSEHLPEYCKDLQEYTVTPCLKDIETEVYISNFYIHCLKKNILMTYCRTSDFHRLFWLALAVSIRVQFCNCQCSRRHTIIECGGGGASKNDWKSQFFVQLIFLSNFYGLNTVEIFRVTFNEIFLSSPHRKIFNRKWENYGGKNSIPYFN